MTTPDGAKRADESPFKKQMQTPISSIPNEYGYRDKLSTLGMRIRQAVDNGYKAPHDPAGVRSAVNSPPSREYSNACVQDNSTYTIPEYKRAPMRSGMQVPMLVNQRTVSSSSTLEVWESQLDERLSLIDSDITRNKLGAGDFMLGSSSKRSFEQLDMENW